MDLLQQTSPFKIKTRTKPSKFLEPPNLEHPLVSKALISAHELKGFWQLPKGDHDLLTHHSNMEMGIPHLLFLVYFSLKEEQDIKCQEDLACKLA